MMMMMRSGSTRIRLGALAIAPAAVLLALAVAGCGGSSYGASKSGVAGAQHATSGAVIVGTRKIKGYGTVLVNAKGHTLYVFMKDAHRKVTCTGACSTYWPPLKQKGMHKATARGGAKAALIGSDKNPGGGRSVTYAHWPLYTYVGDTAAGKTKGEGLKLEGGRWYMISPAGKVIKKKTSSGGGGGTTTTGTWA